MPSPLGDDKNDESSEIRSGWNIFQNAKFVSNLFAGTRESRDKCSHGGCTICPSNYIAHEGKLYCKHHHIQLFGEKGNYSQLENEPEKHSRTEQVTPMEMNNR